MICAGRKRERSKNQMGNIVVLPLFLVVVALGVSVVLSRTLDLPFLPVCAATWVILLGALYVMGQWQESQAWSEYPLHRAASRAGWLSRKKIQKLLSAGMDVNTMDESGTTALHWAATLEDPTNARLLLDNGANPRITNGSRCSPLRRAVREGCIGAAKLLLENGADLKEVDGQEVTHLMEAVNCGRKEMAKFLLENGADVKARDFSGKTALSHVRSDEEMRQLLLQAGAEQ
jgi:hypothetical protein